jgi:hypothetical protein
MLPQFGSLEGEAADKPRDRHETGFAQTPGFQTGDMVRADVAKGARKGVHVGRIAVRVTGSFRVGNADGINAKYCKLLHRADGYGFAARAFLPMAKARRFQRGGFR